MIVVKSESLESNSVRFAASHLVGTCFAGGVGKAVSVIVAAAAIAGPPGTTKWKH